MRNLSSPSGGSLRGCSAFSPRPAWAEMSFLASASLSMPSSPTGSPFGDDRLRLNLQRKLQPGASRLPDHHLPDESK
ncbi:hypothetical protein FALCPG4_004569 [Fusarium falciforme]